MADNTLEFFQGLIRDVVKKLQPYDEKGVYKLYGKKEYKYPEFYDGYNKLVREYESILVHAEKGVFPEELFNKRSPNQTDKEFNYRKENYQQTTLDVYLDFSNSVKRCFIDSNWNIIYPKEETIKKEYTAENALRKYLDEGIHEYGSLENFYKYLYPDIKLKDANGVLAIKPNNLKAERTEDGALVYAVDSTKPIEPLPHYYSVKQVIKFEPESWYLIHTGEKSKCQYAQGSEGQHIGHVFEFYTKDAIYLARQYGKYVDWTFEFVLMYKHDLGKVPVQRNRGIPTLINGKLFWQSQFLYSVDNLNLVALNASNLQISTDNCVYPVRVMIGDECQFRDDKEGEVCTDGEIYASGQTTGKKCSSCHGTGLKNRPSIMGTILIRPKTNNEQEIKPSEAIYYAAPSVETLKFLDERIDKDTNKARTILHLKSLGQATTGENPLESDSNTKANYAFIKPISDQIFSSYQWALDIIGEYREGKDYQKITIIPAQTFDFLTEKDYLAQLNAATAANLPPTVISSIMHKFLNTLYYTEIESAKVLDLIMSADRIFPLSNQDVMLGLGRGTIADWEVVLHQSAIALTEELEREDEKFFEQDEIEQVKDMIDLAKQKALIAKGADPNQALIETKMAAITGQTSANDGRGG